MTDKKSLKSIGMLDRCVTLDFDIGMILSTTITSDFCSLFELHSPILHIDLFLFFVFKSPPKEYPLIFVPNSSI